MRFVKIIWLFTICSVFCFSSCKKDPEVAAVPYRLDVPVLIATNVLSYNLRDITFSLDVAVFKADYSVNTVLDYLDLPDSSFTFQDYQTDTIKHIWVKHVVQKSEYLTDSLVPLNTFSTIILIDQSAYPENFDITDFSNHRFEAFNAFYKNLNGQGKVIFATFARTNSNSHDVVKYINRDFSENWDEKTAISLLDITHQQTGTSGLYDALDSAINYISRQNVANKSITLFARNKDDGKSNSSLAGIISLAKSKQVKINVIWLVKDAGNMDFNSLLQLTSKTGGFSTYLYNINQSSTVFLRLVKLLKMETNFYRITTKITVDSPKYFGSQYSTGMYVNYYLSNSWNFVPFLLEKP